MIFHSFRFFAALVQSASVLPVHSLMLSAHSSRWLPTDLDPSSLPSSISFWRLLWRLMWPKYQSFLDFSFSRRLGAVRSSLQTCSLVNLSCQDIFPILLRHHISKDSTFLQRSLPRVHVSAPYKNTEKTQHCSILCLRGSDINCRDVSSSIRK